MGPKKVSALPIYNSNLGGDGDVEDDYCVVDEPWTRDDYVTEFLCADDEETDRCCLKRLHLDNSTLESRSSFTDVVFVNKSYSDYTTFYDGMNTIHGHIHQFIGTVANTHFHPDGGKPAVDPLFPVFHSFIDYVRLMHTDCYEFDKVPADELESCNPDCFAEVHNHDTPLDYKMDFSILCDETGGKSPRYCSTHDITPRLMFDVSPNTVFKVVYELGDFWNHNKVLQSFCGEYLNASWWSNELKDVKREQFVADHAAQSVDRPLMTTIPSLMVIGAAVIGVLRFCGVSMRRKGVDEVVEGGSYGAV